VTAEGAETAGAVGQADAETRILDRACAELDALRARHAGAIRKRRYSGKDRHEFVRAIAPALPVIETRFGKVLDKSHRVRTQPEEERLMRAASALLYELEGAGQAAGLFREPAALGVLTFFIGDYKDALYWVNLAAKTDPEEVHNKLNGAILATEFFDFELSLRLVDEVLLASAELKPAWAAKARALVGLKLAEEARAAQVEKKGDLPKAREIRKRAQARVDDAASALREVVRIDPSDARAWYEYGKFLFTHSRLKDAAAAYGRAVEIDPAMKLAWYQKGQAHQMLEEPERAVEAFEKGLALDRRDAGGMYFRLAAMQSLLGRTDDAFESIRTGLSINKPNFYSEIYRIEFGPLWGDPRWEALVLEFFADTGFRHTKATQAELGFSWGLFEYGSVLFYDSLADAFGAAEAYRREGDAVKAREFYEKLVALLERDGHPRKAEVVRARLESLERGS
jgi:tetratricopeptide (TPR) repeat protein